MRCTVISGSTSTLFPPFLVSTNAASLRTCSAISGLTLLLMPPVPSPITAMATTNPGPAIPCCTLHGRLVANSTTIPNIYTRLNHRIVAYRPRYWSATTAPTMGVT
jgi:hypothetical protein